MPTEIKEIHSFNVQTSIDENDVFALQHDNGSIWVTLKLTFSAFATWIANIVNFASLTYTSSKTITGAINELAQSAGGYVEKTGTLIAGTTTVSFTDNSIVDGCTVDPYVDDAFTGVVPKAMAVEELTHTLTLTFDEQATDMPVKVRIS